MSCFSFILPLLCFNFSTMPPKRAKAAATTPQAKKSRRLAARRRQSAERPPNTHSDNATQHKEPVVADHASPSTVTLDNVVTNIAYSLSRSMAESTVTAGILAAMQSLPAQGSNAQQRTDSEHSRTDAEDAASLVEVSAMQPRQVAHTEKAVADEINSAVTDILGSGEPLSSEPIRVRHETPAQSTFCSTTIPIDLNVSLKTKNKVWAQEYVDLGVFVSSRTDEDEEFTMNFSSSGKLSLQPVAKKGNVRDLTQWVAPFHVYMAVYIEKFPQAARSRIQYIKTIRDVDKSGGSWRFYDEQFRLEMARNPHVKWHHHNSELWNKAMGPGSRRALPQGQVKGRHEFRLPKGVCFRFHSGKHCGGCRWGHLCYKCNKGDHPASKCRSSGSPKQGHTSESKPANPNPGEKSK